MRKFLNGIFSLTVVLAMLFSTVISVQAASSSQTAAFYVAVGGRSLDTEGNVSSRPKTLFSSKVAETELVNEHDESYQLTSSEGDDSVLRAELKGIPDENEIFEKLVDEFTAKGAYLLDNTGKVVSWDRLTAENYRIYWYVLKYEQHDGWHVDGILYDRATDTPVEIIIPDPEDPVEPEENYDDLGAKVIYYDVENSDYRLGRIQFIGHTPWGHEDEGMHYTVLDERTYYDTDEQLSEADWGEAVRRVTLIQQITEEALQLDVAPNKWFIFGRIDSNGFRNSLTVTPKAYKEIIDRAGNNMYLCIGNANGEVTHVLMIIDENVQHDDSFNGNISPKVFDFSSQGFKSYK